MLFLPMNEVPVFHAAKPIQHTVESFGHTLTITEAEPLPFRVSDFDLSRFGNEEPNIRATLEMIEEWVLNPMIEDEFENHDERRSWEETIPKETGIKSVLDNGNKLGLNQASCVINAISVLPHFLSKDPDLKTKICSNHVNTNRIMRDLSRTGKLGGSSKAHYRSLVQELDQIARHILEVF